MNHRLARSHPAHHPPIERGNQSVIIFLTICTHDRKPILDHEDVHALLRSSWRDGHWRVGRYIIMPDHVHLFCGPGQYPPPSMRGWIKFWKSMTSMRWPRAGEQPVWQRNFWDTQLRSTDHYGEKWEYVRRNPVRAGLVSDPDDWPFQGEVETLMWHDR